MKLITAIIQEDKLDEVREALVAAGITRITVIRVDGHGRQEDTEIYRGLVVVPNLIPKVEL
jgi:nitrogen regulatory protein P-II 1